MSCKYQPLLNTLSAICIGFKDAFIEYIIKLLKAFNYTLLRLNQFIKIENQV